MRIVSVVKMMNIESPEITPLMLLTRMLPTLSERSRRTGKRVRLSQRAKKTKKTAAMIVNSGTPHGIRANETGGEARPTPVGPLGDAEHQRS